MRYGARFLSVICMLYMAPVYSRSAKHVMLTETRSSNQHGSAPTVYSRTPSEKDDSSGEFVELGNKKVLVYKRTSAGNSSKEELDDEESETKKRTDKKKKHSKVPKEKNVKGKKEKGNRKGKNKGSTLPEEVRDQAPAKASKDAADTVDNQEETVDPAKRPVASRKRSNPPVESSDEELEPSGGRSRKEKLPEDPKEQATGVKSNPPSTGNKADEEFECKRKSSSSAAKPSAAKSPAFKDDDIKSPPLQYEATAVPTNGNSVKKRNHTDGRVKEFHAAPDSNSDNSEFISPPPPLPKTKSKSSVSGPAKMNAANSTGDTDSILDTFAKLKKEEEDESPKKNVVVKEEASIKKKSYLLAKQVMDNLIPSESED